MQEGSAFRYRNTHIIDVVRVKTTYSFIHINLSPYNHSYRGSHPQLFKLKNLKGNFEVGTITKKGIEMFEYNKPESLLKILNVE